MSPAVSPSIQSQATQLKKRNWVRKQRGKEGGITAEVGKTSVRRKLVVGCEVISRFFIEEKLDIEEEMAAEDRIIEFLTIQECLIFQYLLLSSFLKSYTCFQFLSHCCSYSE